jgi:hypothetical protein
MSAVLPKLAKKRPRSVTFLAVGVFIFGLAQWWQAWQVYVGLPLVVDLPTAVSPVFRLNMALFWGMVGMVGATAVWRGWFPTPWLLPLTATLFLLYHLTLLYQATSLMAQRGWSGNLLLGISLILALTLILNRPPARHFFSYKL